MKKARSFDWMTGTVLYNKTAPSLAFCCHPKASKHPLPFHTLIQCDSMLELKVTQSFPLKYPKQLLLKIV